MDADSILCNWFIRESPHEKDLVVVEQVPNPSSLLLHEDECPPTLKILSSGSQAHYNDNRRWEGRDFSSNGNNHQSFSKPSEGIQQALSFREKLPNVSLTHIQTCQETSSPGNPDIDSHGKKMKLSPHSVLAEVDLDGDSAGTLLKPRPETIKPIGPGRRSTHSGKSEAAKDSRWAERLLNSCAAAIAGNNILRTQHLLWVLNDLACHSGGPNQRLAAFGLKSLFCRVMGTVNSLPPPANNLSSIGTRPVHGALLSFHDASPWFHVIYNIANEALLESCEGHESVHVMDIGISQGTQWPTFIEALASRPSGPPSFIKLTSITNSLHTGHCNFPEFAKLLKSFAATMGLELQLHTFSSSLESLKHEDLGTQSQGEALVICAQFRLHQLLNEGGPDGAASPRDAFLKFLHGLKPNLFVLSENDADHTSSDFLTRFKEVADFQWKFLDSTNASFKGRDCEERQIMEGEAAMMFHNNVACEGEARIERNEPHEKWKARMEGAGFRCVEVKETMLENARALLRKYDTRWDLFVDEVSIVLRWKKQPTTFISLWRT